MLITTYMHCNPRTAFLCDDIHIYVLQYSYMCFCLYITSMLFVKIHFYTLSKFILTMCAKFIPLDAFPIIIYVYEEKTPSGYGLEINC
jgi:hypothetical protein